MKEKSICLKKFQAFARDDEAISRRARMLGSTALDTALNARFLFQIGVFTAIPLIMGFILQLGLLKVVYLSIHFFLGKI